MNMSNFSYLYTGLMRRARFEIGHPEKTGIATPGTGPRRNRKPAKEILNTARTRAARSKAPCYQSVSPFHSTKCTSSLRLMRCNALSIDFVCRCRIEAISW